MAVTPSLFNRRGTLTQYTYNKNAYGGPVREFVQSKTVWCNIRDLSSSTNPTQGQIKTNADFEVTLRYNSLFTTDWVFTYESKEFKIKSVTIDQEGYKRFMILNISHAS